MTSRVMDHRVTCGRGPAEALHAGRQGVAADADRTYVRIVARLTEERLAALYDGEGMGGERTMRARVIRELIDEIRRLRAEAAHRGECR